MDIQTYVRKQTENVMAKKQENNETTNNSTHNKTKKRMLK